MRLRGRCIGLIGGLGVGATVHYYQELAKAHAARGRVLNLAMVHADMNRGLRFVQAGDRAGLAEYLAGLIAKLARGRSGICRDPSGDAAHLHRGVAEDFAASAGQSGGGIAAGS